MELFDRSRVESRPLSRRKNKVQISEATVDPRRFREALPEELENRLGAIAREILQARARNRSVILAFGAHAIKNGLGFLLGELARRGWVTHLATNGAGIIHDWEFAFQGESSEDVRVNVQEGQFGTWEETGLYLNLALAVGALEGLGYGESVGNLVVRDGLRLPAREELEALIRKSGSAQVFPGERAAAADLEDLMVRLNLSSGWMAVPHPFREYSLQAAAREAGIPFTGHPMFGHDIIYTHRAGAGAAIGRTAERDFLAYVESVSRLEGGVYLSVGSAVMSPMIFEKSLSMARNVLLPKGEDIRDCGIHVVDLQESPWDWSRGEPPMEHPAYYLRFMKTFARMGCRTDYTGCDNRLFLSGLFRILDSLDPSDGRQGARG